MLPQFLPCHHSFHFPESKNAQSVSSAAFISRICKTSFSAFLQPRIRQIQLSDCLGIFHIFTIVLRTGKGGLPVFIGQ